MKYMPFWEIIKKYKVLLSLFLVVIASVFFFRLHSNDVKALTDFVASYEKFDKTISNFSSGGTDDLRKNANDALTQLNNKAAVRISSLVENDGEIMNKEFEIGDFSTKELNYLSAYRKTIKNKNIDSNRLGKKQNYFTNKRKAAYARFEELAGLTN